MESVLPPPQARKLFLSSHLTAVSVAAAAYRGAYGCAAATSVVLGTSRNYWRHPVRGARRNADMAAVAACAAYQIAVARGSSRRKEFGAIVTMAAVLYAGARAAASSVRSSWLHLGMHVLANVANVVMYEGLNLAKNVT